MSGISGYGSPVSRGLEAQNLPVNDTRPPTYPANTEIIQESNKSTSENTTEANPPIIIESAVSDQSNRSDNKIDNQCKVYVDLSEISYILELTDETSLSYEPLYSSEDDISFPKVIDEHDEKRKSCIVIRNSTTDILTEDSKCDYTTGSRIKSKNFLDKTNNQMRNDGSEVGTQKQSNHLLKINEPKEDYTKNNEDSTSKKSLQTQSANFISDETANFSKVENNDKKANLPTSGTTNQKNETKETESFPSHYLNCIEKFNDSKLKKLAQTQKIDKLDQRSNDKTLINTHAVTNKAASNASTTNKEDLQRGETCIDTLTFDKSHEKKPIGISPGKLDILDDLRNPGEGTHYDVGDNLQEKPDLHMNSVVTRKMLTTESQIENLRKIKHILEDKLKCANNPDEEDDKCYQNVEFDPQFIDSFDINTRNSSSDESGQSKTINLLAEKRSQEDKVKSEKCKERETVVENVKIIPDTLLQIMPSTAFKVNDTPGPNFNQSLKQPISIEASLARSEDTSEIIQVILPYDNHIKADNLKAEPKDSCEPCPGIRPVRTMCVEQQKNVKEVEEPPSPPENDHPPFKCYDPPETPEYQGSDSDMRTSRMRLWWWKLKQRFFSIVLGMYNCFHCERICPLLNPARLQSSAAYEASQPSKINNEPLKINSQPYLIHSRDSVLVHADILKLGRVNIDQQMIKTEELDPEKSKSAIIPVKIKSTRFDLNNVKAVD